MKAWIPVAAMLLLAACKPAAEPQPAAAPEPAAVPAEAAAPAADAPASSTPEPIAQTHGGAAAPTPAAAGEADDHTEVNQRIGQLLGDAARYETAILAFQQAVAQKDAATVAAMIDFPFKTTVDGKATTIRNAPEFIAQYGRIVTPAMADAIVRQRYSELFVNYKGVMFGSGEAWLNGICVDKACNSFNVRVVALQPTR
ncbi:MULTISPECIES: hypothetical protein [Pseudoxanthomonas]|uniref:hypothetical protein n=1 Tax=Pseudoxanthomonas TaxID=83618 RepID=UPI001614E66B|nr:MULTISPECIES: hypothetical protein [Pseudoxanthomonas]MBB3277982.1 pyruvate/2-oxoglutarate dehydrogenase complex dihydrolipoamide acyltransferase (E2) component [Pseudoxanthomonas sp. OG2]MBD9375790.1 hypothetical protein [Pseudoxanthomonas sp. PXM04]MBV7474652.1 hypothetical protein [Pseudoxanthomonas sp. PXM05]UBB25803.1 hypothetical protein LAG73_01540 [Pseudoxanthomonas japonensis]